MPELKSYAVWDAGTRWFHWINALCVIALGVIGFLILKEGALGISTPGKVLLKTIHVWTGYVFAANLAWRIVWAFIGNRYARWRAILPGGKGYLHSLRGYVTSFVAGHPGQYAGHNPAGRLAVAVLLLLIAVQAITGLVLAGTDLFYPPFGHWIAQWVAAPGIDPGSLVPYAPDMYAEGAYADMRSLRSPFVTVHLYTFYVLAVAVVAHVTAVIIAERKEGGSLISAMFTGRKIIAGRPVDEAGDSQDP